MSTTTLQSVHNAGVKDGRLCSHCDKNIPLGKLAGQDIGRHRFTTLPVRKLVRNKDCPLCTLVADLIGASGGSFAQNVKHAFSKQMFSIQGSPWATYGKSRFMRPTLSCGDIYRFDLVEDGHVEHAFTRRPLKAQIDRSRLRQWYNLCQTRHFCKSAAREPLHSARLRLIDATEMTLIDATQETSYAALSYVWGPVDQLSLNKMLYASASSRQVDSNQLPKTISDALEVVRILGVRYLWVDSICINQTDETDMSDLIPRMNTIYRNSSLTIVALAGSGADAGLPGLTVGTRDAEVPALIQTTTGRWRLVPARPSLGRILEDSSWSGRGWTLQEHLFSSRCLFFSESECFWSCTMISPSCDWRESYALEYFENELHCDSYTGFHQAEASWDASVRRDFSLRPAPYAEISKWGDIIEEFTSRRLTKSSDVLLAIDSAILEVWKTENRHWLRRFGVPTKAENLFLSLAWRPRTTLARRDLPVQMPTWSWAAWEGPLTLDNSWDSRYVQPLETRHLILDAELAGEFDVFCHPSSDSIFWQAFEYVADGTLARPQCSLSIGTIHLHTIYITGFLDVRTASQTQSDIPNNYDQKYAWTRRDIAPRQMYELREPSGRHNPDYRTKISLDCSYSDFDATKLYHFVMISGAGLTLLLEKVGDVYHRVGMGEFLVWRVGETAKFTEGEIFARNGFQLGWFSIQ